MASYGTYNAHYQLIMFLPVISYFATNQPTRIMKNTTTSIKAALLAGLLSMPFWVEAQVIFRDDFTRSTLGSAWIAPEYTRWSIVGGKAYNYIDGQGGTLNSSAKFPQTSYVIETLAFPLKTGYYRQYGILFGKPNPDQDYGYILKYEPYHNQGLSLGRSEGNEFYPVRLAQKAITLDPNLKYTFRIERYASGLIKVFINSGKGYGSQPVLEATDTTYPALGHIGWRVDTETAAESFYVDWMEARALPSLLTSPEAASGRVYEVANISVGVPHYIDRPYTITSLPTYLSEAAFIQTANDDKNDTRTSFLTFQLAQQSRLYVLYDPRATVLPAWLQRWTKLTDRVGTTDPGTSFMNLYTKVVSPGTITLGGNLAAPAAGSQMNYLVAAVPNEAVAQQTNVGGRLLDDQKTAISEIEPSLSNYPNPAQVNTTIRYQLPRATHVNLAVYDLLGRPVTVLVNERQEAGAHEQVVDMQDMANGVYLYQLETGSQRQVGKMLISR